MDTNYDGVHISFIFFVFNAVLLSPTKAFCPAGKTGPSCNNFNYAFNKVTNQKEDWQSHSSHFAVDDNATTCTIMTPAVKDPWWSVDLTRDMFIDGVDLYIGAESLDDLHSYTVEVQRDGGNSWIMCFANSISTGRFSSPIRVNCQSRVQGRTVKFSGYHEKLNLVLCDVGVYGACVDGSYGDYCNGDCGNCKPAIVCDKGTGHCRTGCDVGWEGSTCHKVCAHGTYGNLCSSTCGECQYNVTCNRYDGECPDVCEPGYQIPMCQTMCVDGRYGSGCMPCGSCKYSLPCNKVNGTCIECTPGYQGELCMQECDDGSYGDECFYECGFCNNNSTQPGPCNTQTGKCDFKCAPGYVQDSDRLNSNLQCRQECNEGNWGWNCQGTCGNCATVNDTDTEELISVPCVKSDGGCLTGCMPGWQGTKCIYACNPGTYGRNCQMLCGHCKDGAACDAVTALCPGECEDGYLGTMCKTSCDPGRYGYQCNGRCPVNCGTNCSNTDGSCVCKDGWTGPKCEDVCPTNHYGKNCEYVCGNCKPGTTCHQGDGHCFSGCDSEWTGLKCDAKKIIEVYEPSYADVIVGSIGGAIALILIVVFVVWIVRRYQQDKSIHIRELASSLRRMSLRGSKSLRRSLTWLSMRGRRNDQQRLGKDIEGPATSNGRRGHKPTVKRMYECVRVQSNLIHYDDFTRIHLQLQEATPNGRTLLYNSFQSFLAQRPRDHTPNDTGSSNAYHNAAVESDEIQVHVDDKNTSIIPTFLPLGANLSGFLLVNTPAASEVLWNHLQLRQIETIISIGKEASYSWRPGERISIGYDVVECIDVQMYGSHKETKLTVQRVGRNGRRAVRHLECFFWSKDVHYPSIATLLMFVERFQQINYSQRDRIIMVNYINLHEQAILFTLVASCIEILVESKRSDVLRTVATGGKATTKSIRTFDGFKYLHDVLFQYITSMENRTRSTAI